MDVDLFKVVGYFIFYLLIGFTFFYFIMFKKKGSNTVSTICLLVVIISIVIGFMSALHMAIINLFILGLAFWFAYIIMKMNKQDKMEQDMNRRYVKHDYYTDVKRKSSDMKEKDKNKNNF